MTDKNDGKHPADTTDGKGATGPTPGRRPADDTDGKGATRDIDATDRPN